MLEKVLLVCNRKAELLRLIEATFDSKVYVNILKSLQKKMLQFFDLFAVVRIWVVKYQLKVFGKLQYAHWTCSRRGLVSSVSVY